MANIVFIALGLPLILGTALFVATEFSLVALDQASVEKRAAEGDKRAAVILTALKRLSLELSSSQVGITLTTILLGYTTQVAIGDLLADSLGAWMGAAAATGIALALAFVITNGLSMIFGELVPKNLALADPLAVAGRVTPLQMLFTSALRPAIRLLNSHADWVVRRFGVEPVEELSGGRSAPELAALVRRSAEEGTLDVGTAQLLTRSIGISSLTAKDVMTDRGRVHCLRKDATAADVVALAVQTGNSRFPVIGEDLDDVLGVAHLRRAVAVPFERRAEVPVLSASLTSEVFRVPETVELAGLLVDLREKGVPLAIVVDEYGGTSGIVTLEDVVEEIVGEVADEHDRSRLVPARTASGAWSVPGLLRPDELASECGLVVPDDGPYETLAGLVMERLGRIPAVGDVVEVARVRLQVTAMDGRRVVRLSVREIEEQQEAEA
ncbi:hemolysin family protein [Buchananella felis]|uniref:hemolysin family protein n=1 Tax=Buchananella felis TaxID=3231492 RepID=UPI003527BBCE